MPKVANFIFKSAFPGLEELSSRSPNIYNHQCMLTEIQNIFVDESNTRLTVCDSEGHEICSLSGAQLKTTLTTPSDPAIPSPSCIFSAIIQLNSQG
ncbi:hypothetical protein CPAR01_04701 [Colletotrichum paranaense]|uniref:Uncharacterized protein n=1 Tax=Colletotrichum paranaense TaxID=1914294 RepID=A0ABQ9SX20_9PEZI|nr:uncharacterized protein CPAR01_04701 [Colletotrichum paranaense]KAK1544068.1 hypothetical protein CPAR01_04701 [Colletotrichum paranaense]